MISKPKVVCYVPSLTETLIECNVNVVGRTQFCIYPEDKVEQIPIVGGTKYIRAQQISELDYDFILLDKEENTLNMSHQLGAKVIPLHIESIQNMTQCLFRLAELFHNNKLSKLAIEYQNLKQQQRDLQSIPGIIRWWRRPTNEQRKRNLKYIYIIWDEPLMAISQKTYIDSVFQLFGISDLNKIQLLNDKYPKIDEKMIDENTILLFSTEPYRFAIKKEYMLQRFPGIPMALIDAELYSWFGVRSLKKIQHEQQVFFNR